MKKWGLKKEKLGIIRIKDRLSNFGILYSQNMNLLIKR